jgi:hypothetical protein
MVDCVWCCRLDDLVLVDFTNCSAFSLVMIGRWYYFFFLDEVEWSLWETARRFALVLGIGLRKSICSPKLEFGRVLGIIGGMPATRLTLGIYRWSIN